MINRGKAPDPWEFGHLLYLVEDQAHFIVDFRILENGITEADILLPQMRQLQRRAAESKRMMMPRAAPDMAIARSMAMPNKRSTSDSPSNSLPILKRV